MSFGDWPGRRRYGPILKASYTVSLDPMVAASLRAMGHGNLSAGIAIAEFQSRGAPPSRRPIPTLPVSDTERSWIVFELVDGPADPPRAGEQIEPFRDCLPQS